MKIRIASALILAATSVFLSGCVVAPIGRPVAVYPAAYPAGPVYYEPAPAPVVVVPSVRFGYYGGYGGGYGYGYRGYRHWR